MTCPMCSQAASVQKVEDKAANTITYWICPVGHRWQSIQEKKDWWKDSAARERDRQEFFESMKGLARVRVPPQKENSWSLLGGVVAFLFGVLIGVLASELGKILTR
jgi:hypothetical protein